jgi:hypothetical protein
MRSTRCCDAETNASAYSMARVASSVAQHLFDQALEQFLVLARLVGLHRPAHELRELGKALRCCRATDGRRGCLSPVKTFTAATLLADYRSRTPMCIGVRRRSLKARCMPLACGGVGSTFRDR